ncbi:copper resistance protein CopC [Ruania zhangjianzhongii]|uniref:copper resistance protein CopC n=1 Tax=Ruania zhangjianzhongii TaxID=2603206 RepID=UPI0011C90CB8|nr:copper resistance protein CopC [Ruania zhangjianzhongii]
MTSIAGKRQPPHGVSAARYLLAAILLGGLLVLTGAQSASAHAELLSTTPEDGAVLEQAPADAVLTFNEPVQLIDGSIRLFPGDGDPLILDAHVSDANVVAPLPADAENGRYALSYRVVSADGHPISGAITFTIGNASDTTAAPVVDTHTSADAQFALSALTAIQYLGLLVFAGLILFDRAVLRNLGAADPRTVRVLRWTGIGAAGASILLVPVSALNVTGDSLSALATPSVWWAGVLSAPVTAAAVVLVGTVGAYLLATRSAERSAARLLALVPALLALAAPVLVGHTRLVEPRALVAAADLGHLLAGSFWAGGVVGLLLLLASARAAGDGAASPDPMGAAAVVARFSRLAIWSVAILAISGTVMGILIVGSFATLFTTGYGLTLLSKVGIIIPIVAIAGYNRFRVLPKLSTHPRAHRWRHLRRTLGCEAALLAVVLTLTGFLTNLSPTHERHGDAMGNTAAAETATISADTQGLTINGALEPALAGTNTLSFTLQYEDEPVTSDEVTIRASLPEHELGPFEITPDLDPASGEYSAQLALPVAGTWHLQVIARVSTFAEPIVSVPVTVR